MTTAAAPGTLVVVETTVATLAQARELARHLVDGRLAACVQITRMDSVYRWHDQVEEAPEYRLSCKTTADRYGALEAVLRTQHPYELPQIYALPAAAAESHYAAWVRDSVGAAPPDSLEPGGSANPD